MNKKYDKLCKDFFKNRDEKIIKEKSQFFTPLEMSRKLIEDLHFNENFDKKSIEILDPSCGLRILTITLIEKIIQLNSFVNRIEIDMIDIDKDCVEKSKEIMEDYLEKNNLNNFIKVNYIVGDYLDYQIEKKYDIIIQNPPFKKVIKK